MVDEISTIPPTKPSGRHEGSPGRSLLGNPFPNLFPCSLLSFCFSFSMCGNFFNPCSFPRSERPSIILVSLFLALSSPPDTLISLPRREKGGRPAGRCLSEAFWPAKHTSCSVTGPGSDLSTTRAGILEQDELFLSPKIRLPDGAPAPLCVGSDGSLSQGNPGS